MSTALINNTNKNIIIHNNFDDAYNILFVGSSITYHEATPETGWLNNCGMAASCSEKDYVHITVNNLAKKNKCINYAILNTGDWEKNYNGSINLEQYTLARDFNANLIVVRIGESIALDGFDEDVFKSNYAELLDFLNKSTQASFILTSSFWHHPVDDVIKRIAEKRKYSFVYLSAYGDDDENMAIGSFDNSNIAMHPSDVGMQKIAQDIINAANDINKDNTVYNDEM